MGYGLLKAQTGPSAFSVYRTSVTGDQLWLLQQKQNELRWQSMNDASL
jgi:hypothetical protein